MPMHYQWASALREGSWCERRAYVPLRKQERRSSSGASTRRPPSPGCSSQTSPAGDTTTSASGSAPATRSNPIARTRRPKHGPKTGSKIRLRTLTMWGSATYTSAFGYGNTLTCAMRRISCVQRAYRPSTLQDRRRSCDCRLQRAMGDGDEKRRRTAVIRSQPASAKSLCLV